MEDETYLQKAEEIIMKHSSRSIRLLILALTLMIAPLYALAEEIPCDHMRDSMLVTTRQTATVSTQAHVVYTMEYNFCYECNQEFGEYKFDSWEENHTFNAKNQCIVCGFIYESETAGHTCLDETHENCVFSVLSATCVNAKTHRGVVEYAHHCSTCGFLMGKDTSTVYQDHYYEGGPCVDCGFCPHDIEKKQLTGHHYAPIQGNNQAHNVWEEYQVTCGRCGKTLGETQQPAQPQPHAISLLPLHSGRILTDNQDGKTHHCIYQAQQVCQDCGFIAGQVTAQDAAQVHGFSVTVALLSDESGHWERKTRQCACGFIGYTTDEKEEGLVAPHSFKDGICTECQYACRHAYENEICTLCGVKMMHTYILKLAAEGEIQPDGSILYLIGADQQVEIILHCVETDTDHLLSEFMAFSIASPDQSMHYMPSRTENGKASLKSGAAQGALALMDKRTGEKIHTIYFALQ